jgi:predicted nucleic acid-binding protein
VFLGRDVLLDAGPLVALLDKRDRWHPAAARAWPPLARRCVTLEAVVVEATHMVAKRRADHALVLEFLLAHGIPILAPHLLLHEACLHLMRRYAAAPMDYADATLVALAGRLGIHRIFTFDRRGFGEYRPAHGRRFEIIPAPPGR